jgi:NAD(P)-dependent dehydrogenase (short-subunit alcohol dehydrogenase family)
MSKRILITGASGGFGKLTTLTLLKEGHKVAASMRNVQTQNKEVAAELEAAGAQIVELDVTDNNSVTSGVNQAIEMLRGIDVVINNAGVGVAGMQEHFTPEDFQKLFDINVFGVQRVNRAVLPHLRKQGSGLVIYISSLLGRMSMPFYGPYNASKWALEALAENYRIELSGFGVDSCIIEPGGFETTFFTSLLTPSDESRNQSYGEFMNVPQQFFEGFAGALAQNKEQKPQNVADAISKLISTSPGERPLRTPVDSMGMGAALQPYNEMLDQITAGIFNNFGMGDMLKLKV